MRGLFRFILVFVIALFPLAEASAQQEDMAENTPSEESAPSQDETKPEEAAQPEKKAAEQQGPATTEAPPAAPRRAPKAGEIEEITVTGSRIERSGTATPTPTTVLDSSSILQSGKPNVAEVLNELPAMANAVANQNTTYSFGNSGLNQVNLRGLGVRRTLTILNGRRAPGTPDDENFLAFDLSIIPPSLVERIEVITGGTSAVYGADAVAGVVNIITKKNFEGVEFTLGGGTSRYGDANTYDFSGIAGTNFDEERGNVMLAVGLSRADRVYRSDRAYQMRTLGWFPNPANTGTNDGIPDRIMREGIRSVYFGIPNGAVDLPVDRNLQRDDSQTNRVIFDENGNLRLFDLGSTGILGGTSTDGQDGSIPSAYHQQMTAPNTRLNVFGQARYNLFGSVNAIIEGNVARTYSGDHIDPGFAVEGDNNWVHYDNPYVKKDLYDILRGDVYDPSDDQEWVSFTRQHREYGGRDTEITRDFMSLHGGLEGVLPNGWDWQAYYQFGRTSTANKVLNDQLDARFAQALDAVVDPTTGEVVCRDQSDGCVPITIMGPPGTITQEGAEWVTADHTTKTFTTQHLATAFVRGDIVELPAGDLGFVVGGEFRQEGLDFQPSDVWLNATGFYATQFTPVKESFNVKEAFAELNVPLVRDLFMLHELNLEGALRFASYDLGGENLSWKFGGYWSPVPDIRVRAVYARANRAPALGEMFQPGSRGALGIADPCDELNISANPNRAANCAAAGVPANFVSQSRRITTLIFSTGNPELEVEQANTLTAGGVFTPTFLPGFALTADYWAIHMYDVINRFGSQTTINNCYDAPNLDNPFCSMVTRRADGNIEEIRDTWVNVSEFDLKGLDMEASYRFALPADIGTLRLRGYVTRFFKYDFTEAPEKGGVIDEEAGELGLPKWRGGAEAAYGNGGFALTAQYRYVGTQVWDPQQSPETRDPFEVPATWYAHLNVRYAFADVPFAQDFEISGGIRNLFDKEPPRYPAANVWRGNYSFYDPIGRYFYLNLTTRL